MLKFSIIVPVYGVEKYISKCIESVKKQTLKEFECLIIDDDTKDNSIKVAQNLIKNDNRFEIYHKEKGGLSDTRNYGIERAQGEYILFLDSDDYIAPTLLEDAYHKAKENNSDIVCFDMMYVYENGEEKNSSAGEYSLTSYKENPKLIFINNSANNKIFKKSFLENRRFIKGIWYEDLASVPIWLAQANNVSFVKKPLYYYLQREGSISHSADKRIFDIYKSINIIKKELNLKSEDLANMYYDNCLVMTTLRIRAIEDKKTRKEFYLENVNHLFNDYPNWAKNLPKGNYNFKQKIVFKLLEHKMIDLLDWIFR